MCHVGVFKGKETLNVNVKQTFPESIILIGIDIELRISNLAISSLTESTQPFSSAMSSGLPYPHKQMNIYHEKNITTIRDKYIYIYNG